jgi:hypothetical protein
MTEALQVKDPYCPAIHTSKVCTVVPVWVGHRTEVTAEWQSVVTLHSQQLQSHANSSGSRMFLGAGSWRAQAGCLVTGTATPVHGQFNNQFRVALLTLISHPFSTATTIERVI